MTKSECPRPNLQCLEGVWKRLHPDEEGGYDDGRGVVGTVVALCRQISYRVKVRGIKVQWSAKRRRMINKELNTYLHPRCSQLLHIFGWTPVSSSLSELPLASTGHGKLKDLTDRAPIKGRNESNTCFRPPANYMIVQDEEANVCDLTSDW